MKESQIYQHKGEIKKKEDIIYKIDQGPGQGLKQIDIIVEKKEESHKEKDKNRGSVIEIEANTVEGETVLENIGSKNNTSTIEIVKDIGIGIMIEIIIKSIKDSDKEAEMVITIKASIRRIPILNTEILDTQMADTTRKIVTTNKITIKATKAGLIMTTRKVCISTINSQLMAIPMTIKTITAVITDHSILAFIIYNHTYGMLH